MKTRTTRHAALCLALALGAAGAAQAQSAYGNSPGSSGVRGVLGLGFTFGGDDLAKVAFVNGGSQTISAGQLVDLKIGAEFPLMQGWSAQTTIGYHFDRVSANNGTVTFQRFPIEGLAFYRLAPQFKLGAGVRLATSPQLSGSGAAGAVGSTNFSSKVGVVVEGEYAFSSQLGLNVRAVSEKYGVGNTTVDGSHVGIGLNYYF